MIVVPDASVVVAALTDTGTVGAWAELFPYPPLAARVWELRSNVTYAAWYVALGEALDAEVATLDGRLTRASGPRCSFRTP